MRAMEPKTDDPALYPAIAVEPPDQAEARSALIEAGGPDGAPLAQAVVGIRSASIGFNPLGGMFVRRPDEARAWLVEGSVDLPDEASAWFEPIVHVPGTDVRRVTIYDGGMMRFDAVKEAGEGSTYRLAHLADALAKPGVEADDSAVKQLGLGIISTQFDAAKRLSDIPFPADARRIVFETKGEAAMRFDDRAADRQSHAHAAALGRVERIEQALRLFPGQAGVRIRTSTRTPPGLSAAVPISKSRDCSLASLIASAAFMIRFRMTCCSWIWSPRMDGKPRANSVCSEMPFRTNCSGSAR